MRGHHLLFFLSLILGMTCLAAAAPKKPVIVPRTIVVDAANVQGARSTVFNECIGAGRANEGLRADWQAQLVETQKACNFKFIRMHGLLHDDMGVYTEDAHGNPVYNWQYIDKLHDFLLSIGIRPFVELSFMPRALADMEHEGLTTVFWWNGIIKPPKSYERWGELIRQLTLHLSERYGEAEVAKWYFEVWNEPNLNFFWAGSQEEYFQLYKTAAEAIKSVCSDYRVGGPATAGNGWVQEMIDFCVGQNVPLDFIATHDYGVLQGFFDDTGNRGTVLDPNENAVKGNIIRSREVIAQSPRPDLELHYTEWSSSYTPTDFFHDTYQQAAYILDKIKGAEKAVTSMSYWVFTDIFEESAVRMTPFHGGFGLMNYQGLKKPAFYAYQFLNQLGDVELVNNDRESWACRNERGDVQILFWDFTIKPNPDSVNNQIFYRKEHPAAEIAPCRITINNVQAGKYALEIYRVGYRSNDVFTAYLDMGAPSQLSRQQEGVLRSMSSGEAERRDIITVAADGALSLQVKMHENDVVLYKLFKL